MTSVNAPLVHPDSPAVGLSPRALPPPWSAQLAGQLAGGETVLASLEVDLDDRLRFARGIMVVTSDRLLVRTADDSKWQSWSYRPGLALSRSDHSGVGHRGDAGAALPDHAADGQAC
jgi:ATP-binding cassette subfamily B protein